MEISLSQTKEPSKPESGLFLLRKAVFLLNSSIGMSMAETLVNNAVERIGSTPEKLAKDDVKGLAGALERPLSELVGTEKAAKLTSALRVLVGGMVGSTEARP